MEYACLAYDVPLTQRSLYAKLRKRIRKIGLPMTSSVYLIPLGARQTVQTILDELESEKPNVIESCIIKFDDSEEKVIKAKAERALSQMIRRTKEQVIKKLEASEKEQTEAVKKYDELIAKKQKNEKSIDTSMEELLKYKDLAQALYEAAVKQGLKKAENTLKEARNLAVVFNMTNNMEAAFLALDGFVKQKWELVGVKSNTAALAEVE
jgi:hypothetical protein